MADSSPIYTTQVDISAGSLAPESSGPETLPDDQTTLLREMVILQKKTCDLLSDMLTQVSQQQRQRAAELKAWKESHPELAQSCRKAAQALSAVHTHFLATVAEEAAENAEVFTESDYALSDFIDRHGPRIAHFNGVMQLFSQLGAPVTPPKGND
jgi:hypothetical protein